MPTVDIGILVLVAAFGLVGLWRGLVHMVAALVSLYVAVAGAARLYEPLAHYVAPYVGGNLNLARFIGFFAAIAVIRLALSLLLRLIDGFMRTLKAVPFVTTFNHLLGALLGVAEGVFLVSLAIYLAERFPIVPGVGEALKASVLAPYLARAVAVFTPLFPEALRLLKDSLGPSPLAAPPAAPYAAPMPPTRPEPLQL